MRWRTLGKSALCAFAFSYCCEGDPIARPPRNRGASGLNALGRRPTGNPIHTVPKSGTIDVRLAADKGAGRDDVVSTGVPFPRGVFFDEGALLLRSAAGRPVPIATSVLARWPLDGSIRSVLVAFKATLPSGARETWKLEYGGERGPTVAALRPNPDGPVSAVLPPEWYANSHVSGYLLPVEANVRFAEYDVDLASWFEAINFDAAGVSCRRTNSHRTYYDGPHARYQLFLRTGEVGHYRAAREESRWYREHEVTFYDGKKLAVQSCQPDDWDPSVPMEWSVLRRMASQGNLDDYLVSGDASAREVVLAFGEAYRQNLPALAAGEYPALEATERNLAWTMMGLTSYYALDARAEVADALVGLVERTAAWQSRGTSGAFEHDLRRPDPLECMSGPRGASPFLASLLVDGLMDYWLLTEDTARVEPIVRRLAEWFETTAITSDRRAFRYLWNCATDPYDSSRTADLNILIGHVFGAAYLLTKDEHWLDFGDTMADHGLDVFQAKLPKQWNQAARSFGRYLGYRAHGRAP